MGVDGVESKGAGTLSGEKGSVKVGAKARNEVPGWVRGRGTVGKADALGFLEGAILLLGESRGCGGEGGDAWALGGALLTLNRV